MTTVVVTSKLIAADRKIMVSKSSSSRYYTDGPKVHRSLDNTFAYAMTGMESRGNNEELEKFIGLCLRQLRDGDLSARVHEMAKATFTKEMLILTRDNFYHVYRGYPYSNNESSPWFSIGSGDVFATMAMLAGRKPADAIRFASTQDILTGNQVDIITATTLKAL